MLPPAGYSMAFLAVDYIIYLFYLFLFFRDIRFTTESIQSKVPFKNIISNDCLFSHLVLKLSMFTDIYYYWNRYHFAELRLHFLMFYFQVSDYSSTNIHEFCEFNIYIIVNKIFILRTSFSYWICCRWQIVKSHQIPT